MPFLGVSTYGTGLRWLPGVLQRFQSLLAEAPFVQLPLDGNDRSLGPPNGWVHETPERLKKSQAPLPMAESREVLRFPEHLRQISAEVRVPVQITLGEYDTTWESSCCELAEFIRGGLATHHPLAKNTCLWHSVTWLIVRLLKLEAGGYASNGESSSYQSAHWHLS